MGETPVRMAASAVGDGVTLTRDQQSARRAPIKLEGADTMVVLLRAQSPGRARRVSRGGQPTPAARGHLAYGAPAESVALWSLVTAIGHRPAIGC